MLSLLQKTSEGWHRQHIAAALSASLEVVKSNIITILIFVVLGSRQDDQFALYLVGASFILVLFTGIVRWWTFTYQTEPGVLRIKKGVLIRRDITLSSERIQVMDIAEGFVERIFGLVNLRVQTGSQQEAVQLRALSKEEAKRVIQVVLNEAAVRTGSSSEAEKTTAEHTTHLDLIAAGQDGLRSISPSDLSDLSRTDTSHHEEKEEIKHLLSTRDLVLAAITSGGLGIALSILGTLYSQLEAVLGVSVVVDWVVEKAPGLQETAWSTFLILFILFFLIAWILSTAGFLLSNSGFVVRKYARKLVISRGLIERKQTTLPFDRIQAVRFVEGVLRQPIGRGTLYAESAGFGSEQGSGSTLIYPLIKKAELSDWMQTLLPAFTFETLETRPPLRALSRFIRRYVLPVAVLFGVLFARNVQEDPIQSLALMGDASAQLMAVPRLLFPEWMGQWVVAFVLTTLGAGLYAFVRWRSIRIGLFVNRLSTRSRRIAQEQAVIPSYRLQSLELTQSWFQKRRDLCSIHIRIASGLAGRSFTLPDLEFSDGEQALYWFREEIRSLRSTPPSVDRYRPDSGPRTHHPHG